MGKNDRLFIYIITIFCSLFLLINFKRKYFDEIWDFCFSIQIMILNIYAFIKHLKERKNEKNVNK